MTCLTEADAKRLLEFAGFTYRSHSDWYMAPEHYHWYFPDGMQALNSQAWRGGIDVPSFAGLDDCFKWLEPPLYERFGIYHIGFARVKGVGYNCYMNRAAVEYPHREEGRSKELMTLGHGKTLGEAFCSAALRVIDRYPELEKGIIERLVDAGILL